MAKQARRFPRAFNESTLVGPAPARNILLKRAKQTWVLCVVTLTTGKRFTGTQDASASLRVLDVAGGDLAFVGGEGCQDFGLLMLRDLEEI